MAEYKTSKQVNYGFGLSFEATGKAPVVAKRIWATLADAQAYVDSSTDTAIRGLVLAVIADSTSANNGIYWVSQAAGDNNASAGVLTKLGSSSDVTTLANQIVALQNAIKEINDTTIKSQAQALIDGLTDTTGKTGSVAGMYVTVTQSKGKIDTVTVSRPTAGKVEAGNGNLVDGGTVKTYVDNAINTAVASTFKPMGCYDTLDALNTAVPVANRKAGYVYNIKSSFVLPDDGKTYPAGTNVVWVDAHSDGSTSHAAHWDALGGTYDLSIYKEKQSAVSVTGAVSSTITALSQDANGKITATVKNIQIESRQVTDLDDDLADLSSRITTAQNTANAAKTTAEAAVPKTTTVNGKALSTNITIGATDIAHGLTGTNVIKTASPNTTVKTALSDLDAKAKTDSDRITALENKTVSGVVTGITAVDKTSGDPITLTGTIGFDYDSEEQEIKFATTNKVIFAEINRSSIAKEKLEGTIQTTLEKADSALQPEDITGSSRNYISVSVDKLESGDLQISATPSVSTNIVAASTGQLADAKAVQNYVNNQISAATLKWSSWE